MADASSDSPVDTIRLSELIGALSRALDLTEGQAFGHSLSSCLIGMQLAQAIGLDRESRSALFYALLLKDAGCSSNAAMVQEMFQTDDLAAKRALKMMDWTQPLQAVRFGLSLAGRGRSAWTRLIRVIALTPGGLAPARRMFAVRCERGAEIVRMMSFPETTAQAIRSLDEHWDGRGYPAGLTGEQIPLLARIAGLSQSVEIFRAALGPADAMAMIRRRSGSWFDPELVRVFSRLAADDAFWSLLAADRPQLMAAVAALEPPEAPTMADSQRVDQVALAFAQIIDAKSPYTYRHSEGVAKYAVAIGRQLDFSPLQVREMHLAGLLHDIGKLGVPNTILDKAGPLTHDEMEVIRRHPRYSEEILSEVAAFSSLAEVAAVHHERVDGKGYYRGVVLADFPQAHRTLPVADIYEALTADRPYRQAMSPEAALALLHKEAGSGVCPRAVTALEAALNKGEVA
ncbi:MAG: HD-GYP domain-containing protein [Sulfobacillus sp.]